MTCWQRIQGLDNYEVSTCGQIRSMYKTKERLKVRILRPAIHKGYYRQEIKGKQMAIHRLVAMTFLPNPENKPEVNHKDGNKLNNDVTNLEWVSPSENRQHAYDSGLKFGRKGSKHHNAFITENEVLDIRAKRSEGETMPDIARQFGLAVTTVWHIIHRKTWNHI